MDGLFSYIELINIKDMVLQKAVESHKQKETHIYKLHSLFRELLINFPISFSTRNILTIIFSLRSFQTFICLSPNPISLPNLAFDKDGFCFNSNKMILFSFVCWASSFFYECLFDSFFLKVNGNSTLVTYSTNYKRVVFMTNLYKN